MSRLERDALPIVVQRGVRRGILGPSLVTVGLLVGAELVTHFLPGTRVPPGVEEGTRATLSRGVRGAQAPSEPPLVSPEEAERFNRRGVELAKSGDLDGAILQFVQAIAADPQNYKSHNNLGVLYRRRGFIQQAINAYQTASEIEPQDPIPYKNLAILYEEAARAGEALRYYAKYLALAPRAPDARSVKARVADLQDRAGARRLPANVQPASVGSRFSSRTEAG